MQSTLSFSPSFNTYSSSDRLAQIAARVVSEFRQELGEDDAVWESIDDYDQYNNLDVDKDTQFTQPKSTEVQQQQQPQNDVVNNEDNAEDEEGEEEEFEFAFVSKELQTSPISADDVFYNGQIRPVYPVFDQKLLLDDDNPDVKISEKTATETTTTKQRRLPLRMLMIEEERETASCSSSEADDLENLPPGTYCVWAPPKAADKGSRSSSTGSSKRWKFRDLLSRSSSDGGAKETFVFFPPPPPTTTASKPGNKGDGNTAASVAARNARKSGKGASEEVDKRRTSYLPYRQDLIGFFSNVNGLSRNLHPF